MLVALALVIGFILGLSYVFNRRSKDDKTAATFLGCLGSLALAIVVSIAGSLIWDLWHWLSGTPNYSFLKEWIYFFAFGISGFAGVGWLVGGVVAHFIRTPP